MDNDDERKSMMSRPIPARPKGAPPGLEPGSMRAVKYPGEAIPTPPPSLDELIKKRQSMKDPAKFEFGEPIPGTDQRTRSDPFAAFAEIVAILTQQPKATQKQIIEVLSILFD